MYVLRLRDDMRKCYLFKHYKRRDEWVFWGALLGVVDKGEGIGRLEEVGVVRGPVTKGYIGR